MIPKMDLSVEEMGFYILWLTSFPCDKNWGERPRAHGPSCFLLTVDVLARIRPCAFSFEPMMLRIMLDAD